MALCELTASHLEVVFVAVQTNNELNTEVAEQGCRDNIWKKPKWKKDCWSL